jgi:hypothetical protein
MTPDISPQRVSYNKLMRLEDTLQLQDKQILQALVECRFMNTNQMIRLAFGDIANSESARRTANRSVARMRKSGLITALQRRIGGVRAGSGSYIWSITPAGVRFLSLDNPEEATRRRKHEPSHFFINHTLAITELYVQLACLKKSALIAKQFEPQTWRYFTGPLGANQILKPDFYARTADKKYEDDWFFEVDLATEAPSKVVQKCVMYQQYYLSGAEQRKHDVFPLVVWIVPNRSRKASLQDHISRSVELRHKNIFVVITPDELETLVRKGAGI